MTMAMTTMTTRMLTTKDSGKRKQEDDGNKDDHKRRCRRNSLRCDDANLKVLVGGQQEKEEEDEDYEDGGTNNMDTSPKMKVFWYYSHVLASLSRYVDTLLSAPLAALSKNKDGNNNNINNNDDDNCDYDSDDASSVGITEISFPEISPSQWKRMIVFLTDPVATRNMSKEDAMELVFLYDKYDFHTGIKLCDEVLSSMFYKNEQEFKERMNNLELLDRCVQVIVLSYEKSLKKTLANGMIWLETVRSSLLLFLLFVLYFI